MVSTPVFTVSVLVSIFHRCVGSPDPFTWTESAASLPNPNTNFYLIYEETYHPDIIFVLGGTNDKQTVYNYSIAEDTLTYFDTLENGCFNFGRPGAVMIGDVIYYGGPTLGGFCGGGLYSYNLQTREEAKLLDLQLDCVAKHATSDNNLIYFLTYRVSEDFFVYDVETNTYYEGQSLNDARFAPSCVTTTDGYLYVLLGDAPTVERININSADLQNEEWVLLNALFEDIEGSDISFDGTNRIYVGIPYMNYIFLLTGYNGQGDEWNEIFYYDIELDSFAYLQDFAADYGLTSGIFANDRIYLYGGYSGVSHDNIWYTNALAPECKSGKGESCNWCRSDIGCMSCRAFYERVDYDGSGYFVCERIDRDAPSVAEVEYLESECSTDNCLEDDEEVFDHCKDLKEWGCKECQDAYFRKNNDYPCVECNIIPNCLHCNTNAREWGGCDVCDTGYARRWDVGFGYIRCIDKSLL